MPRLLHLKAALPTASSPSPRTFPMFPYTRVKHSLPYTRGRLTRGAQLTAGYTVNTYSKPPLYYTLGAVARRTHSGLADLCRTRTDTRRATDTTYQPTSQPASQPAVLPVNSRFNSCDIGLNSYT